MEGPEYLFKRVDYFVVEKCQELDKYLNSALVLSQKIQVGGLIFGVSTAFSMNVRLLSLQHLMIDLWEETVRCNQVYSLVDLV